MLEPGGELVTTSTPIFFTSGTYRLVSSGTLKIRCAVSYPFISTASVCRPFCKESVQGDKQLVCGLSSTTIFAPGGSLSRSTAAVAFCISLARAGKVSLARAGNAGDWGSVAGEVSASLDLATGGVGFAS